MKQILGITGMLLLAGAALSAGAQQPVESVYKANCAPCHGAAGDANTPAGKTFKVPPFGSDVVLKESDASMMAIAKNGKGKMPAWHDKLSDEQLQDLIAFIHTLQKK
jgi:mono/diheme cytochrome c family protein